MAIGGRDGFVAVCADDEGAARLAEKARAAGVDIRTYGESESADYRVELLGLAENGLGASTSSTTASGSV